VIVAETVMLAGALLILLAAVGMVRFRDVLARMHALSKASTLGFVLVLLGGALGLDDIDDYTFVLLAGLLQVLTSPVGANLISRATYRAGGIPHRLDETDELAARPPRPDGGRPRS
jgi:multicomponent Na+:H+ antiporter subunit G